MAGSSSTEASVRRDPAPRILDRFVERVPSADLKRYFMSQICSAMGAAKRVMAT
jgi:hypothetical protein